MANENMQLLAEFYRKCSEKGYYDMTDSTQSLKAKVIASDMGLPWENIKNLYEKSKKANEQLEREAADPEIQRRKQEELRREEEAREREELSRQKKEEAKRQKQEKKQRKEEEKRRQEEEKQNEINKKLAVKGELFLSFTCNVEGGKVEIYRRPDESVYYILNDEERIEGKPELGLKRSMHSKLNYNPSKLVYTGATVGGVSTGGFHQTDASITQLTVPSNNGYIVFINHGKELELEKIIVPSKICEALRRDDSFMPIIESGGIINFFDTEKLLDIVSKKTKLFSNGYNFNVDYAMDVNAFDESRCSLKFCAQIYNLLNRLIQGDCPKTDEHMYSRAKELAESDRSSDLQMAIELFEKVTDYPDATECAEKLRLRYEEVLQAEKEAAILEEEESTKRMKKNLIIALPFIAVFVALMVFFRVIMPNIKNNTKYDNAVSLMETGNYDEAIVAFQELGDFKDSKEQILKIKEQILKIKYQEAMALYNEGKYNEAASAFGTLKGYSNSKEMSIICKKESYYQSAIADMDLGHYSIAKTMFDLAGDYKDSKELSEKCQRYLAGAE